MVRTHPPVVPLQIDVPRVLGWSTALALHLLALMLLLIPAAYVAAPLPRERTVVNLITPPVPQPEPPLPIPPQEPVPVRAPTTTPRVAPLPLPTASADDVLAVPPLAASDVQTPTLAPVEPTPAASGDGAQLQYRTAPPPSYPIAAIRAGEQGTVTLRVQVDADGKPTSVSIERSSGSRALDHAARQQVLRNWRFVPAQVNGQAVPAVGLVPVSFSLPQ
ncbi:energy transducer TonB [Stenotrophomonas rhizophila]|uniref:energy transducer TonB n=1 Tax=Stenotrophomonas rhizophila TaxID=216778 RepID=UPI00081C70C7|nr:energy transducer TonB [Stenotrophomonas rhizophila]AOA73084.1 Filamentous hemagglutinin [Stenotrophomonas rhizophila]